jgi:hypothetical protein
MFLAIGELKSLLATSGTFLSTAEQHHRVTPAFLATNKSPNKSRVFSKLSR